MKEWWRGAKLHPGWFSALAFMVMTVIAAGNAWYGWAMGAFWPLLVALTCRSVARANPDAVLCGGCKREIDPDCCGCGDSRKWHGNSMDVGHNFIPMGCDCYRARSNS